MFISLLLDSIRSTSCTGSSAVCSENFTNPPLSPQLNFLYSKAGRCQLDIADSEDRLRGLGQQSQIGRESPTVGHTSLRLFERLRFACTVTIEHGHRVDNYQGKRIGRSRSISVRICS